jgi:CBS domain-containing protein
MLPPAATVQEACKHMHNRNVVPCWSSTARLVGIFTGRDTVRVLAHGQHPATTRLTQVMTENPECLPPRHPAIHSPRLMRDGGFRMCRS